MSAFRRIIGMGPAPLKTPESYIAFNSKDGNERLRMVADTSASAIAGRYNQQMIYGKNNMPPEFAMRGVIEVKGQDGEWTPVTGSRRGVPNMEAQMAALSSFRENGVVGPAPRPADAGASTSAASGTVDKQTVKKPTEFDKMLEGLPGLFDKLDADLTRSGPSSRPNNGVIETSLDRGPSTRPVVGQQVAMNSTNPSVVAPAPQPMQPEGRVSSMRADSKQGLINSGSGMNALDAIAETRLRTRKATPGFF